MNELVISIVQLKKIILLYVQSNSYLAIAIAALDDELANRGNKLSFP